MTYKLIFLCLLLCVLPFGLAQGQEVLPSLPLNEFAEGQISTAEETAVWSFYAFQNEMRSFYVEALDEGFDPVIALYQAGDVVIQNDDLQYPESNNALLEGISIPRSGDYEVVVSGYGGTTGRFRLVMLPGYAQIEAEQRFAELSEWVASESLQAEIINEMAFLQMQGVQSRGVLERAQPEPGDTYYASASVESITGRGGWAIGFAVRIQPNGDYYGFMINAQGQWRAVAVQGTEERVLRDWAPHPAIVPGEETFNVSVLANGNGFELFYNEQFVGKVNDDAYEAPGRMGMLLETANAADGEITVLLEGFLLTVPFSVTDQLMMPGQLAAVSWSTLPQELERRNVIPAGGQLIWNLEESFVDRGRPGVTPLVLIQGSTYENFALGTSFTPTFGGEGTVGCGLMLQYMGEDQYWVAYADNSGAYGISQRQPSGFDAGLYGENSDWAGQDSYDLLLIAQDDQLDFYVNNTYVGREEVALSAGEVGNVVLNFDPVTATCQFRNTWLWQWES